MIDTNNAHKNGVSAPPQPLTGTASTPGPVSDTLQHRALSSLVAAPTSAATDKEEVTWHPTGWYLEGEAAERWDPLVDALHKSDPDWQLAMTQIRLNDLLGAALRHQRLMEQAKEEMKEQRETAQKRAAVLRAERETLQEREDSYAERIAAAQQKLAEAAGKQTLVLDAKTAEGVTPKAVRTAAEGRAYDLIETAGAENSLPLTELPKASKWERGGDFALLFCMSLFLVFVNAHFFKFFTAKDIIEGEVSVMQLLGGLVFTLPFSVATEFLWGDAAGRAGNMGVLDDNQPGTERFRTRKLLLPLGILWAVFEGVNIQKMQGTGLMDGFEKFLSTVVSFLLGGCVVGLVFTARYFKERHKARQAQHFAHLAHKRRQDFEAVLRSEEMQAVFTEAQLLSLLFHERDAVTAKKVAVDAELERAETPMLSEATARKVKEMGDEMRGSQADMESYLRGRGGEKRTGGLTHHSTQQPTPPPTVWDRVRVWLVFWERD